MDRADPTYIKTMNQFGGDPNYVNTPPLHTGYKAGPPTDETFKALAARAKVGEINCQRAVVAMYLIVPYSDYGPVIHDEFERQFTASDEADEPMELYLYELAGQLIMSDDYDIYTMYKRRQLLCASCIIIGPYTKVWGMEPINKPYRMRLSSLDPDQTNEEIVKNLRKVLDECGVNVEELVRIAGLDVDTCYGIISGDMVPSIGELEAIARGLGIKSSDILPF